MVAAPLTRPAGVSRYREQRLDSCFDEVRIARECLVEAQLAHHDEAAAVGERISVIGMLPEERSRCFEPLRSNPFDANASASLHELEHSLGDDGSAAYLRLGNGLVDYIVRQAARRPDGALRRQSAAAAAAAGGGDERFGGRIISRSGTASTVRYSISRKSLR